MHLNAGTRLGPYEILAPLGAGGMGEVYRARDSRLDRDVALKLIPLHADHSRFQSEAKAVAALNHPNIVAIFDVGENYLVTELVDGSPLPIPAEPIRKLLDLAIQIADGLAAAHAAGFIHRDLKPGNILVSKEGRVKILDFGLAKRVGVSASEASQAQTQTQDGFVVGTVAYMSPEQARGAALDPRSDQFSFGLVLYEMITGKRPFQRATAPETMTAILRDQAAPVPADVAAPLRWIVDRCLAKEPGDRYGTTRDLYLELRNLRDHMAEANSTGAAIQPTATPPAARKGRALPLLVTGVALGAAMLWYARLPRNTETAVEAEQKLIPLITDPGIKSGPVFSPDGASIAYFWRPDNEGPGIFKRGLAAGSAPVRLTQGGNNPAWSRDGRYLGFLRQTPSAGSVMVIPATGGPERKVADVSGWSYPGPRTLEWTPDGKWILAADKPSTSGPYELTAFSVETGEKRRVTNPPSNVYGDCFPILSPDGSQIAFLRISAFSVIDIYTQPLVLAVDRVAEPKRVTNSGWAISALIWGANGRDLLFTADHEGANRLWRVSLEKGGPPLLAAGVPPFGGLVSISGRGDRLAWVQSFNDADIYRQDLPLHGEKPPPSVRLIASSRAEFNMRISPDGRKIVFPSNRTGSWEIWLADSDGGNPVQLTSFGGPENGTPRWSPDSSQIAFDTRVGGKGEVFLVDVSGGTPRPFPAGPGDNLSPSWSHDGKWIYFISNRLGQEQLWKKPVAGGAAIQLSHGGAVTGFESADGKFVYFARTYERPTTIWRIPADGGEETSILDNLSQPITFDVTAEGIYYLHRPTERDARRGLLLYSFATQRTSLIAGLDREFSIGLSMSPDRHWFAFAGPSDSGRRASDVMVVEHFR